MLATEALFWLDLQNKIKSQAFCLSGPKDRSNFDCPTYKYVSELKSTLYMQHQFKILALNEELQTVDGKQYTDVSASNYSKFELNL